MKSVFKYELEVAPSQQIDIPEGFELLSVQVQKGRPCLWALVDTDYDSVPVSIHTYGTGHPALIDNLYFLGTYQLDDGDLVFHVFQQL